MSDNYIGTPWRITNASGRREIASAKTGELICQVYDGTDPCTLASRIPRLERIIACVNACEGINPDAVPDLLAALRAIAPDDACPLHPELLSPFPGEPEHAFNDRKTKYGREFETWRVARAAIAKAEGKQ